MKTKLILVPFSFPCHSFCYSRLWANQFCWRSVGLALGKRDNPKVICFNTIEGFDWFRSPVLRGNWINASAHKTWRRLYFFLIFFPYQVLYQKTCQILGFLNIHELCISRNANFHKMGRIHDIWDNFWPQHVLF